MAAPARVWSLGHPRLRPMGRRFLGLCYGFRAGKKFVLEILRCGFHRWIIAQVGVCSILVLDFEGVPNFSADGCLIADA